jgi:PTH1 family peptidyl-tRNA hydrolase
LESIERQLGTRQYPRLRLGIGRRQEQGRQITDYVLGRFAAQETEAVNEVLLRARQAVECWLTAGIQEAMNRFNGAARGPQTKGKE